MTKTRMKFRITGVLLTLAMLLATLSSFAIPAFAAEEDGSTDVIDASAMTADELQAAVTERLNAGHTAITVNLAEDADATMFSAITAALATTVDPSLDQYELVMNYSGTIDLTISGAKTVPECTFYVDEYVNENWRAGAALRSVTLTDATTIGESAFFSSAMTSFSAPNVIKIEGFALEGCMKLTDVYLPSVQTLGDAVFSDCYALKTISLPECIDLGNGVFNSCEALETVYAPKATNLGAIEFMLCTSLMKVTLGSVVSVNQLYESIDNGLFCLANDTKNIELILACDQKALSFDSSTKYWTATEEALDFGNTNDFMGYTFKSITMAHTPEADDGDCTTALICSACGETVVEAKESHTTELDENKATCQHGDICDLCDSEYGVTDPHSFVDGKCACGIKQFDFYGQQLNIGGDLSMKYYVIAFGDGVSTETLTMEFLFLGKKTEVSGVYDSEIGMYVFTLDGINPQCMGDEIDAYLLLDGEEKANKLDYTVEANLLTLREKYKDDTALVTLVNDILAYGSAASEYKGYGSMTDDYVGSNREIPTTNVAPSDAFIGYTVTFGQMNYIKIRVNLADGNTLYLGETDITNELVDGIYKTAGIAPTDFDNVFNFTVKNGDETVATFALSVNDYISANKDSESMGKLVNALYNYGVSAEEYARPIINLTQYADGETIDITQSGKIIGDGTEYNLSLNIAEDVTVVFYEGTGGVKLNAITVADNKTLTLQVKGNVEYIVKEGISIGNGSNVIIEGERDKENNKLTVTATDGNAAIGANNGVTAGDITIRNARVEATGSSTIDTFSESPVSGAAIGTSDANMGDILIENSIITATGSSHSSQLSFAAAIGMGSLCRSIGNMVFIDSEITAKIPDETLASVIGAGSIMHGEKRLVCTMGDIIFTNTSLDLSIVQNLKSYGALIGIGETDSYSTVKMGKIIFTDMTQAELDAMMATWTYPEDFAEWGAYIIGRSPYNMVNENGTIEGVYVSDGNGGTVQIGNADGYNPTGYVTNWGW